MTPLAQFEMQLRRLAPRTAVVLGSGLSEVAGEFQAVATLPFADVPDLVPPTVAGHRGQVSVGEWNGVPSLVCAGRVHFYEGHSWSRVTRLVHTFADWGLRKLLLTNAAGGIRDRLDPGDLMPICGHCTVLNPTDWQGLARGTATEAIYPESEILARLAREKLGIDLQPGIYAALTGPCYETPAEIRAFRSLGADAVGMSTAGEARAGRERGLAVAGLSVITNKAAGLAAGFLSHREVEQNAKLATERLSRLIPMFIATD